MHTAPNRGGNRSLRQRAEAKTKPDRAAAPETPSRRDAQKIFHELQVHKVELEMQNEELLRVQEQLEASIARYFGFYDLAPVGYLTVSERGLIREANLTAASQLGVAKRALIEQPLTAFIFCEDQDNFYRHQRQLFNTGAASACELRLLKKDGAVFWAHLASSVGPDTDGACVCRLVISDITDRRALESEILKVGKREQLRIGEDLHDGLGQQLTAIELMCASLQSDLPPGRSDLNRQVAQMAQFLREAIHQTRILAHDLMGFRLSHGLPEALTELAQSISSLGRVQCRFDCPMPVSFDDVEIASHLYRIAQEAVHNAVKHARARQVTIRLTGAEGELRLQVSDDGNGLPFSLPKNRGMGLQVMRHRASLIGAQLNVESKPGQGVTVTCTWRGTRGEQGGNGGFLNEA